MRLFQLLKAMKVCESQASSAFPPHASEFHTSIYKVTSLPSPTSTFFCALAASVELMWHPKKKELNSVVTAKWILIHWPSGKRTWSWRSSGDVNALLVQVDEQTWV